MPANTRFLVKLVLFVAPIAVYVALTAAIPLYAGEFSAVDEVAARQSAGEAILYGPAYRDNYYVFKRASTIHRRPDVLVLGSSRSMQFRAGLFGPNERFYNAGGAAQSIFEARRFVMDLPADSLPRVLMWPDRRFNAGGGQHSPEKPPDRRRRARHRAVTRAASSSGTCARERSRCASSFDEAIPSTGEQRSASPRPFAGVAFATTAATSTARS